MQKPKPVYYLTLAVLFLASFLGGGQGFFGDVLAQLAAIALLIACLFNGASELRLASKGTRILAFAFIATVLFLPLLQLYPWPNTNEFSLAMRQDLQQVGVQISNLSLNKTYGAERALFFLLPSCAIFIACLQLPNHYRYRLLIALAIIVVLNVLLGFAQLAQGQDSPLRLYEITNITEAVGFFANRNHFASLLMMCLPLSVAATVWFAHQRASKIYNSPMLIIGGSLFCILIVLAIVVARSRAGLLLAVLGMLFSLPAFLALPSIPGMKRVISVVVVTGALVIVQFGLVGILQRFDQGIADSSRSEMRQISIEAGKAYAPMGAGLGTFRQAYAPFEAEHSGNLGHAVANHAHNDYAELWLEAGYPALFVMIIFWLLVVALGIRVWWQQKQAGSFDVLLSRVAWVGVFLALLHSYADYPLRTTADASVFTLLLAVALACSRNENATTKL